MKKLVEKYVGQNIGINFMQLKKYDIAYLVSASDEYFTIKDPKTNISYTYQYKWIMNVIEAEGGISTGGIFSQQNYPVLIEVFHFVVYSGSVGVGVSF